MKELKRIEPDPFNGLPLKITINSDFDHHGSLEKNSDGIVFAFYSLTRED